MRRRNRAYKHLEEEQQRNQPFLSFPLGGLILYIFFVARCLRYARYRFAPRALNMNKISSAQLMVVRIPHPLQHDPQKPIPNEIIKYPGMIVKKLIDCAIEKEFWGASLLNINLPKIKSNKME